MNSDPKLMKSHDFPEIVSSFEGASTEMLAAVLDQSVDCIKVIGPEGQLEFMNRNGRCAMEIDDFAMVAGKLWWDLWPDDTAALIREAFEKGRTGESSRFEAFCPTAKGTPRWWDVSASPLRNGHGEIRGLISVSRDVTERVQANDLRMAMADEMRHRLQNAYALAGAIVTGAARGSPERQGFAQEILERLERLGVAQSLLLDPARLGSTTLDTLTRRLTEPFCNSGCDVAISGLPDVNLNEQQTRTLALAIGELSTNSNKYGALCHGGEIAISGSLGDGDIALNWAETSHAPVTATEREGGAGFALIARALAAQRGSHAIDWRPDGLTVSVRLPLAAA